MSKDCNCVVCRHTRKEISTEEARKITIENLKKNPNNDSIKPFSELDFEEDCLFLYELEDENNNAYMDDIKKVSKVIHKLLLKYNIIKD